MDSGAGGEEGGLDLLFVEPSREPVGGVTWSVVERGEVLGFLAFDNAGRDDAVTTAPPVVLLPVSLAGDGLEVVAVVAGRVVEVWLDIRNSNAVVQAFTFWQGWSIGQSPRMPSHELLREDKLCLCPMWHGRSDVLLFRRVAPRNGASWVPILHRRLSSIEKRDRAERCI